ncbi:hypothetical protein HDV05_001138 [Chytridiales sp. JEL 0842]|nr:hypothetical protein HDV05_001138 [Chytridiales sp. JEL 0842]
MTNIISSMAEMVFGEQDPQTATSNLKTRPDSSMLALRFHGPTRVSVDTVPIPAVNDPQDVVVKVTGTTICGSDLHLYHNEIMQLHKGDVLGHEFAGVVDEVGSQVKNFKKGDRVVASAIIGCGHCDHCKNTNFSMCSNTNPSNVQAALYGTNTAGIFGYSHFVGGYPGGQAEYVRVPFADVNLLKIPNGMPDEKALYLSDILPTSYHSVLSAEIDKGKTVAVWGLGPIGLLACRWSQIRGAKRVIGIDCVRERLQFAQKVLGCDVIDFKQAQDINAAIRELEPSGVDCCIDAAGFRFTKTYLHAFERAVGLETDSCEVLNEAIKAVKKYGIISIVADYAGSTNAFNIGAVMEKGITLRGTGQTPVQRYWKDILGMIEKGEIDPTLILTHRFRLEEMKELYEAFDKKEYGMLKVFVETQSSAPRAEGTPELSFLKSDEVKASKLHRSIEE